MRLAAAGAPFATAPQYFPVSVCCTSDYCAMRDGSVAFTHLAHTDGQRFLLREGLAVAMLPPPSATLAMCEALVTQEEGVLATGWRLWQWLWMQLWR